MRARPDAETAAGVTTRDTPGLADTVPHTPPAVDGSIAGLSDAEPGAPAQGLGIDAERYTEVEVIGEGGLGTVLRAKDRYLDREVALKRIGTRASGAPGALASRFLREARITARLDHPNIVPIHDTGTTSDGRVYYTMRLIRGQSLAQLSDRATTPEQRLGFIGALTAACHAIGHAHRKRIIHRDLKPANIMIGDPGETQVVDWGLAEALDEPEPHRGFAGTLPYASPEIVDGTRPTIAADVWALGVTLHEVITGEHRFSGDREEILAALAASPMPPARWPAWCPPELSAIGDRAMQPAPGARYADAEEMARDLEAFRDGRRVAAHRYSALEMARRLVIAWRWPLAATGALIAGTIVALALTAHRTERQRVRAVAAEAETRTQLERAEVALADALAAGATRALAEDAIARAELTAIAALAHAEHPLARGVLSATHAGPRPRVLDRIALPGCDDVTGVTTASATCVGARELSLWRIAPPSATRAWAIEAAYVGSHPIEAPDVAGPRWIVAWTQPGEIAVLDAANGREHARSEALSRVVSAQRGMAGDRVVLHDRRNALVIGLDGTPELISAPCGARAIDAAAATSAETWFVCERGLLLRVDDDRREEIEDTGLGSEIAAASALAVSEDGLEVAMGTIAGDVVLLDLRGCFAPGCETHPVRAMLGGRAQVAVRHLVAVGGSSVIAIGERGDAVELVRGRVSDRTRLPIDGAAGLRVLEGGEVITGGRAWQRWKLDDTSGPAVLHHGWGIVTAAIATSGRAAAALTNDGELVAWTTDDGVQRFATAARDAHTVSLDGDGEIVTVQAPASTIRYRVRDGSVVDTTAGAPLPAASVPTATAGDGTSVRAEARQLSIRSSRATSEQVLPMIDAVAVAIDDAASWLAAADARGDVQVWHRRDAWVHVATLSGHTQRVTTLVFTAGQLWSAGTDGRLRRWALDPLVRSHAELAAAAEQTWGPTTPPR